MSVSFRPTAASFWACLLALVLAAPAGAGPWPRGAGEVFVSAGLEASDSRTTVITTGSVTPSYHQSLYAEVGVSPRLTFALDLNRGEESQFAQSYLRYTVTAPEAPWQLAADLGAARHSIERQPDVSYARLGLSLGRGLAPGGGHWMMPVAHDGGWATLDVVGLFDLGTQSAAVWQVEGTLGLTLHNGWRAAVALKAEEWPGSDLIVTASPSLMIDLGARNTLQIGARIGLEGSDTVGLTLNLWHQF